MFYWTNMKKKHEVQRNLMIQLNTAHDVYISNRIDITRCAKLYSWISIQIRSTMKTFACEQ